MFVERWLFFCSVACACHTLRSEPFWFEVVLCIGVVSVMIFTFSFAIASMTREAKVFLEISFEVMFDVTIVDSWDLPSKNVPVSGGQDNFKMRIR